MSFADSLLEHLQPFVSLSYPTDRPAHPDCFPDANYYGSGPLDVCLCVSVIIVMAVLRDAFRLWIFEPFVRWKLTHDLDATKRALNGAQKQLNRSVLRFAEQGWALVFYTFQWCSGAYVHWNLPHRIFDHTNVWSNYPHYPLAGPLKLYYLTGLAFYMHQVLIINAEERRKDHVRMMTHHVITVLLMGGSYFYNVTRIGCLIMVIMDFCDILLPLAKMAKYLAVPSIVPDSLFVLFLMSWFVTRHIMFVFAIVQTAINIPMRVDLVWAPERGHYMTHKIFVGFISCLVALEILQCLWFYTAVRIAWRVATVGEPASDDRSDDEGYVYSCS
ncbi:longevity assurance proteins LAG1/LAC1 [Fistulina hepatica ATCC 64428]|uniref:Longevity assurance proteins LAG1/LAC1 n=1 Tax=Fistulina hepatica ATCC 64428 TaxID=1128425 RepID=A0A0D7AIP0_9AGAR|nr:longevity assurance proteins LAG1/LAC1 [Fistulina hepatica ATCC 64428]